MFKILWKSLLVSPAILGAALAVSSAASAAESAKTPETFKLEGAEVELTQPEAFPVEESALELAQVQEEATVAQDNDVIEQIDQYSQEGQSNSLNQVTSVSELRDVSPTSWAYEALRSLVERYGCIVGYPDRTFRGDRALSRWEFAAGLNACMNVMERLIQENVAVLKEDIDKLKKLMEEFQAELAALGARVDNLEARTSFLEDHQFSTTTKLTGEVIFAFGGLLNDTAANNQVVFQDRVRLVLNTSFTGEDRLVTRLAAGNGDLFQSVNRDFVTAAGDTQYGAFLETNERAELFGARGFQAVVNEFDAGLLPNETERVRFVGSATTETFIRNPAINQTWQNTRNNNNVDVDWLAYYAPIKFSEDFQFQAYIPAWGGLWYDFVPTLNPYFEDYDGGNGSLSIFAQRNPIYNIGGGTGLGGSFQLGFVNNILGPTSFSVGYMSGSANDPSQGEGLFNGNYTGLAQINFNLFDFVNLGFTYSNSYLREDSPIFGNGARFGAGNVGTPESNLSNGNLNGLLESTASLGTGRLQGFDAGGNLIYQETNSGAIDDAFGLEVGNKSINAYGIEASMKFADWLTFSAFGTYANVNMIGIDSGDIWSYGGGFAFPDLGKEGNVLGIFAGVQPYLSGLNIPIVTGDGTRIANAAYSLKNPVHVEAFYKYQVTDNISVTPGIIWVKDADQVGETDDQLLGTIRATFTF